MFGYQGGNYLKGLQGLGSVALLESVSLGVGFEVSKVLFSWPVGQDVALSSCSSHMLATMLPTTMILGNL